jgi:D-lactate dehydrogenase (cytochrome)
VRAQYQVPVIPFGVGFARRPFAGRAGRHQHRREPHEPVLSINAEDLTVTVQPGVTRKQLNEEIKRPACSSRSTRARTPRIGGMTATRASGTNAVRYGTMRENVLALEVVTAAARSSAPAPAPRNRAPATTSRA